VGLNGKRSPTILPCVYLHKQVTAENFSFWSSGIASQWYLKRSNACGSQESSESKVRNNYPLASRTPRLKAMCL
jgi:hypothetical protein